MKKMMRWLAFALAGALLAGHIGTAVPAQAASVLADRTAVAREQGAAGTEYADEEQFLKDLAEVLHERTAFLNGDIDEETDPIEATYDLLSDALDTLQEYDGAVFEDETLTDLARNYFAAIRGERTGVCYVYDDYDFGMGLLNGADMVHECVIYMLYKNYGLELNEQEAAEYKELFSEDSEKEEEAASADEALEEILENVTDEAAGEEPAEEAAEEGLAEELAEEAAEEPAEEAEAVEETAEEPAEETAEEPAEAAAEETKTADFDDFLADLSDSYFARQTFLEELEEMPDDGDVIGASIDFYDGMIDAMEPYEGADFGNEVLEDLAATYIDTLYMDRDYIVHYLDSDWLTEDMDAGAGMMRDSVIYVLYRDFGLKLPDNVAASYEEFAKENITEKDATLLPAVERAYEEKPEEPEEPEAPEKPEEPEKTVDGEVTVASLLEGMQEAAKSGMAMDYDVVIDMTMSLFGESESMKMDEKMHIESVGDLAYITMEMSAESDGETTTGEGIGYTEKVGDKYVTYMQQDGEWTRTESDAGQMAIFSELFADKIADEFELSEEDGAYVVSGEIKLDDAASLFGDMFSGDEMLGGSEDLDMSDLMSDLAPAKVAYRFDKETKTLTSADIDMTGTMQDLFDKMIEAFMSSEELSELAGEVDGDQLAALMSMFQFKVNDCTAKMHDVVFDDTIEIVIPDEVRAAAEEPGEPEEPETPEEPEEPEETPDEPVKTGAAPEVGTWRLTDMTEDGEPLSDEDRAMMEAMAGEFFLELNEDGTGLISMFGDTVELRWADGKMFEEGEEDDAIEYTIDGDTLTMGDDEMTMTFTRGGEEPEKEPEEEPGTEVDLNDPVGTWKLVSMKEDGETISDEDLAMMEAIGMEITLELKEDGTGVLTIFDETTELHWKDGIMYEDDEDDAVEYVIEDGVLTMGDDTDELVFAKEGAAPKKDGGEEEKKDDEKDDKKDEDLSDAFETKEFLYENSLGDTYCFVVVHNGSDTAVRIDGDATALDKDGKELGDDEMTISIIGPDETSVGYFYFDDTPDVADVEYDLDFDTEPYEEPIIGALDMELYANDTNVTAVLTNTADVPAAYVQAYAFFFDDDEELIGYDYAYVTDLDNEIKPGATIGVQVNSTEDYQSAEVYLVGAAASEYRTVKETIDPKDLKVKEYSIETAGGDTRYFLVVTNDSDEVVRYGANGIAYNEDGEPLGAGDFTLDVLGPGETSIGYFYLEGVKDVDEVVFTQAGEKDPNYLPVISDLETEVEEGDEEVEVTVTNNGDKAARFPEAYVLFFDKDDNLVACDYAYMTDDDSEIKPGASVTKTISAYEEFDHAEVYLTGYADKD